MVLLLLFAFLAGLFTVLSPCVLPVLPIVLSVGSLGGRLRPLGLILGLVFSFTLLTLALATIIQATGIPPDLLRYVAILFICLFGLVMIFPTLSNLFARLLAPIATLGQRIQGTKERSGFAGGFLVGLALGALWTPCAGPILGAITTLAATQSATLSTLLLTLSYSIGAGIPLFCIAYGGSRALESSRYLAKHSEAIRKGFGGLMILAAFAIWMHWDMYIQTAVARVIPPILIEDHPAVKKNLEQLRKGNESVSSSNWKQGSLGNFGPAPELVGIVNWINSPPLSLAALRGKVVLIDFWTYTCINCLRTLPYVEKWYADYKQEGLVVIGVHTPEFAFEKSPQNVAAAVMRLGILYPVAQDNDYATWNAYHNQYWPAHYLIDQQGNLRFIHFGEGDYVEMENNIRNLLGLAPLNQAEEAAKAVALSPETYLGTLRGRSYASGIQIQPGQTVDYSYSGTLGSDEVGLKGPWLVQEECITAEGPGCYLDYNFLATKVYLVLAGSSSTPLEVFLDGQIAAQIEVQGDRKYDIVTAPYGRHQLSLKVPQGISAYAFTFGGD